MERIEDHQLFVQIADTRSLVNTARALGLSTSAVSRQLKRIEGTLGVTLVHRTTRSLSLTEEGEVFYASCRRIDEEKRTTKRTLHRLKAKPVGRIKLTVTPTFAYSSLMAAISEFVHDYPEICFDVDVTDEHVDLASNGIDLAIRIGQLNDSRLRSRRLMSSRIVPCVSPAYVELYGVPEDIDDLANHNLVSASHLPAIAKRQLQLLSGLAIADSKNKLTLNDVVAIYQAVKQGVGLSFLPEYLIGDDLKSGRLIEVLSEQPRMLHEVYALYVDSDYLPHKTRVFIDFLAGHYDRGAK